jgi:hypothetical protein
MKWVIYDSPAALKDLIYYKQLAGLARGRGINKSQPFLVVIVGEIEIIPFVLCKTSINQGDITDYINYCIVLQFALEN